MNVGMVLRPHVAALLAAAFVVGPASPAWSETHVVGPDDYRDVLPALEAGDTLALEGGDYRAGLPIHDLQGTEAEPIHIAGPEFGEPAVFHGRRGHNVVSIVDSAWVAIRSIEIDGGGLPVDGVKLEGHADFGHHITLTGLTIHNLADHQQVVGISTKAPARGWVVRDTEIRDAGTGMYFGSDDGTAAFVDGLIEYNLVTGSIGYAMQIKHQDRRPDSDWMPVERSRTIIRHNVFAKDERSSTGAMARPNLLLGHFPPRGPGSGDGYAVYGNLLYNNPAERLFQGEGNIALYNNLLVNPSGNGLAIMPHNGHPRRIAIFHNTLVAAEGTGMWLQPSEETERLDVLGNLVFAERPFSGDGAPDGGNVAADHGAAADHLRAPFAEPGELDLMPIDDGGDARGLDGMPVDVLWALPDTGRDFDGEERTGERWGAYDSERTAPRWQPALEFKPRADPVPLGRLAPE